MPYVDGFLNPVPKRNRDKYRRMSLQAGKVWMDHGALGYHECVADDVRAGKRTSFPQGVKLRKGEEVWFSWIVYRSRQDRDRVNARAMKDPRLAKMRDLKAMPFDSQRRVYGGFRMLVDFSSGD
jgi:uncharacterized protein YbaA (DUF1428 family)